MKYKIGDIIRVDLGIRMDSTNPKSRYLYVKVYKHGYTYMITAIGGWKPFGWSDWTLDGMLANGANKGFKKINGKEIQNILS